MSFIKTIAVPEAEGPLKAIYDQAIERAGGVAEIIKIMSLDANVCRASLAMYLQTLMTENVLDRATRELLATVVSNVNDCYY